MKRRKPGRKYDPKALSRTGYSHTFLFSETDEKTARRLMEHYAIGFTDLVRLLIRQEADRLAHNGDVFTDSKPNIDEPTPPPTGTFNTQE